MDVLLHELRLGNLDFIVGTLPSRHMGLDLEEQPLFEDATALVARTHHPLVRSAAVPTWQELVQYPWVMPPHDSLLRQPLLQAFMAHGVEPPVDFIETLSPNVIVNYLQGSDAVATLPTTLARKYSVLGGLATLALEMPRLVRPVGVLWLRGHRPGDPRFVDCLEQAALELIAGE